jgi:predicted transcriptional regulator
MSRIGSLLLIILLAALLLAPLATANPSSAQRESGYLSSLQSLKFYQNSDGGFGPVQEVFDAEGNSTNITQPARSSFLQTVLVVHLLVLEETDRVETWQNWEGVSTSLARSNATTALKWLQEYEKSRENSLTPGDRSLLALAYHDLGDAENARQILTAILDKEADGPSHMGAHDVAQLLFVQTHASYSLNGTQNATLESLDERLAGMQLSAPEPLSWALLAQPDHGDRRAALADRLSGDMSVNLRALGAWALAQSGGPDVTTEDALLAVYQYAPQTNSLAHLYLLFAERTANPHFSPHVDLAVGGAVRGAGSQAPPGSTQPTQEPSQPVVAPQPEPAQPAPQEPAAFPVPTWVMMSVIAVALAVLLVTGLAYGLKREDLDGPRKEIFNYIDSHPGEHFSKIRRDLGLAPGTFQHHLSVLESGGWITSYKDARYKRYFVNGNRYKQMIAGYQYKQKFAALANDTTRDLVQFVREHPGVTQKEVALRLNLHASTVNWHANRLKQAGILNPERVGREVRYHVDDDVVRKMLQQANN